MYTEFVYPEFDASGKKQLSTYGAENDMMMDIAVYKMKKGDTRTFLSATEETAAEQFSKTNIKEK